MGPTMASTLSGTARTDRALSLNMKLLSHHELEGFGGIGEGMGMQLTKDGRRILWMAHESAPKNFTAVDVTDPKNPKMVVQTELPHAKVRSNSLDVVGNVMAVAYQTSAVNMKPAGFDLFDISRPESPKLISHFDASGPYSRGVHAVWFVDGEYIHMASGAADFQPTHPSDDQFYRIIGVRNTNVFPERPDRAYIGYISGGAVILDISDKAHPKLVSHWHYSPPYTGFTHTVLPLFKPELLIVSDECVQTDGKDWPKLVWVVDARMETNLVPISTCPMPPVQTFTSNGGRFGAHNLHENLPVPGSWRSESIIVGTFFGGGVRAFDVSNPYRPEEIAYYVPPAPKLSKAGSIQLNDVYVDDRGIVFTVDRFAGGLYALEMTV